MKMNESSKSNDYFKLCIAFDCKSLFLERIDRSVWHWVRGIKIIEKQQIMNSSEDFEPK